MNNLKTPTNLRLKNLRHDGKLIPGSPLMTPLGCGTGKLNNILTPNQICQFSYILAQLSK